jgi:hypothetical protein
VFAYKQIYENIRGRNGEITPVIALGCPPSDHFLLEKQNVGSDFGTGT